VSAGEHLHEPGKIAYSIPQFCAACAVGRTFVYEEIKAGRLRAAKAGRRTLIDAAEARRWFASLRRTTA
jgi:excisionase family DNA binding protein